MMQQMMQMLGKLNSRLLAKRSHEILYPLSLTETRETNSPDPFQEAHNKSMLRQSPSLEVGIQ